MRKFKRLTMTLALLLTAVGGAWAQSSLKVVEFEVPAEWEDEYSPVTAADLPGFYTSTLAKAQAWTGAPAEGNAMLIYAFDGDDNAYHVPFVNGTADIADYYPMSKANVFQKKSITKIYYTVEPTELELTPDETGKTWTLAKMPASNVELQVEYEPTKVTMAANDNAMGTVEVSGESKVEWTADTWKGWTADTKVHTVDDITMTCSENANIREYTYEGDYKNSLFFIVYKSSNTSTVTFSTTGAPFSRIEFTMVKDHDEYNPSILPNDNWTIEGKSAVWEGEATKSLTLQSCSTSVNKITFFKGAVPDGVTVNGDGTFTVAKTATVTLTATPAEGYKFLYWEDDQTNTNPVREVTIESGLADMTYTAVFAEILYNVTFVEGTNLNEWSATPNPAKTKQTVTVTYSGEKKVIGVKVEKKKAVTYPLISAATAEDYGKVVCAAGHLHDAKTAVPDGCTAVGILGKVTETGHGLILALKDAPQQTWNTIDGWTSASYAGTTLKVLPDDAARGTNLTSYTTLGETTVSNWAVAQKSDYEAIFINLGSKTGDSDGTTYDDNVNAYITGAGGTAISDGNWSATENTDEVDFVWYFANQYWYNIVKTGGLKVRPVLAF